MKKILWLLLFLAGCATKPVKLIPAPTKNRSEIIKKELLQMPTKAQDLTPAERLIYDFLLAKNYESKNDVKSACEKYEELSENEAFPLKELAQIKAMQTCDYSPYKLKRIWKNEPTHKFLREMYFENSYLIAKKLEISNYQAIFANKFSELKKIKQDKINLIKEAQEIASKLNMDEAREYSNKLLVLSPQLNTTITKDNKFLVAKDFESSRNFEQARILYLEIIKDESQPLDLKIKSYNAYRTTYKLERKLSLFIEKT